MGLLVVASCLVVAAILCLRLMDELRLLTLLQLLSCKCEEDEFVSLRTITRRLANLAMKPIAH